MIIGIVAVDKAWAIGKNNGLLFNIPADMKHFRETTAKSIVVCGRKTLESFPNGKPLKGRTTIVLCSPQYEFEDCICAHSVPELIKLVQCLSITNDIYIIGGGQIYSTFLPYYDKLIITEVETFVPDADTFFPDISKLSTFQLESESALLEDDGYSFRFKTYIKVKTGKAE